MKMKLIKLLALGLITATTAFGANVDLSKSSLKWEGSKVTGKHHGEIFFKKASVEMKEGKLAGGDFVVNMDTFTITDLDGAMAKKFLGHMKSKDFFETEKFPEAKLKIKSVKGKTATADLTIKGKTNEVKFDLNKEAKTYSGVLKFDRTKFDMRYGSGDFFKNLGDKMINNDVKVNFKFVVK